MRHYGRIADYLSNTIDESLSFDNMLNITVIIVISV